MSEVVYYVLSALAEDRPGLVAEVARFLAERGCNIEDSRMAILGSDFGMMLLISGTPEKLKAVEEALPQLEHRLKLRATLKPTQRPTEHQQGKANYLVKVHSLDHPGIVYSVADALYASGANIVTMETEAYDAPETGTPFFKMIAQVNVPPKVNPEELFERLHIVAHRENLDLEITPLNA